MGNLKKESIIEYKSINFSGLHCNYLPPTAVAWFQASVSRKWECQCGRTPCVTALDPWHLHPGLQALLPAWRHSGKPPHSHLQQWHCTLRPAVHSFLFFFWFKYFNTCWHLVHVTDSAELVWSNWPGRTENEMPSQFPFIYLAANHNKWWCKTFFVQKRHKKIISRRQWSENLLTTI